VLERVASRAALSFGDRSRNVVLGRGVVLAPVEDDRVQWSVKLPVAAAAESMPCGLAAGGRDGGDAGETREGGPGSAAASGPGSLPN